jgi:hypothetical protein
MQLATSKAVPTVAAHGNGEGGLGVGGWSLPDRLFPGFDRNCHQRRGTGQYQAERARR